MQARHAFQRRLPVAVAGMAGILLVQGFHEIEHIVQVLQRSVFENPKGAGVLGSWLDIEPVHVAYNVLFLALLALVYVQGRFWQCRRNERFAFGFMTFSVLFQGYHLVEHIFKIVQFAESGINGTPGILGHLFNLVWLHFAFNTIVFSSFLVAFIAGRWDRDVLDLLRLRRSEASTA
jgi:hypothetical protein